MYLFYGVLVLFAVALFWPAGMILCRRPDAGWYGNEFMQAYFWAPLSASGLCLGVLMVVKAFVKFSPSALEVIVSVLLFAITLAMYRLLCRWVPPVDAAVAETETRTIPFDAKHRFKTPASVPTKPGDSDMREAV